MDDIEIASFRSGSDGGTLHVALGRRTERTLDRARWSGSEEHEQHGRRSHRDADHGESQHEALAGARIPALP
jgi:hypothetical protein